MLLSTSILLLALSQSTLCDVPTLQIYRQSDGSVSVTCQCVGYLPAAAIPESINGGSESNVVIPAVIQGASSGGSTGGTGGNLGGTAQPLSTTQITTYPGNLNVLTFLGINTQTSSLQSFISLQGSVQITSTTDAASFKISVVVFVALYLDISTKTLNGQFTTTVTSTATATITTTMTAMSSASGGAGVGAIDTSSQTPSATVGPGTGSVPTSGLFQNTTLSSHPLGSSSATVSKLVSAASSTFPSLSLPSVSPSLTLPPLSLPSVSPSLTLPPLSSPTFPSLTLPSLSSPSLTFPTIIIPTSLTTSAIPANPVSALFQSFDPLELKALCSSFELVIHTSSTYIPSSTATIVGTRTTSLSTTATTTTTSTPPNVFTTRANGMAMRRALPTIATDINRSLFNAIASGTAGPELKAACGLVVAPSTTTTTQTSLSGVSTISTSTTKTYIASATVFVNAAACTVVAESAYNYPVPANYGSSPKLNYIIGPLYNNPSFGPGDGGIAQYPATMNRAAQLNACFTFVKTHTNNARYGLVLSVYTEATGTGSCSTFTYGYYGGPLDQPSCGKSPDGSISSNLYFEWGY